MYLGPAYCHAHKWIYIYAAYTVYEVTIIAVTLSFDLKLIICDITVDICKQEANLTFDIILVD